MDTQTVVQRRPGLEFSRLDEAYLAIDAQEGYCYGLNTTGGIIWEMLGTPISVGEVCGRLRREYSVAEETCRQDVVLLLSHLEEAGLVQVVRRPENAQGG